MNRNRSVLSVVVLASLLSFLTACGDDDAAGGGVDNDSDSGGDAPSDAGSSNDEDGGGNGGGEVGATITIDGTTYTADNELVCVTFGGALSAQFHDAAGEIQIAIDLPPEGWESDPNGDWDPPSARVDVGEEAQYESGRSDIIVGMPETAVASYSIDGVHGEGAGEFVDMFQLPADAVTVPGSFEVTCAE